jgi:hypothetical protein
MNIGDIVILADTARIGKGFRVKILSITKSLHYFCSYPAEGTTCDGIAFTLPFAESDLIADNTKEVQ